MHGTFLYYGLLWQSILLLLSDTKKFPPRLELFHTPFLVLFPVNEDKKMGWSPFSSGCHLFLQEFVSYVEKYSERHACSNAEIYALNTPNYQLTCHLCPSSRL